MEACSKRRWLLALRRSFLRGCKVVVIQAHDDGNASTMMASRSSIQEFAAIFALAILAPAIFALAILRCSYSD